MKKQFSLLFACGVIMMTSCQQKVDNGAPLQPTGEALFSHFSYIGDDDYYKQHALPNESSFYNPILPGFYPDPTLISNGQGDYYLACSSFTYFPGVPLFHSRDLVNWEPAGHILDRESQMENMIGQQVSGGIFAPALTYNPKTGTYYMITTNVGAGNFYVKTQNPAGCWSDPIHVPSILGIDPSIFIDDDGKAYIVNNDDAPDNKPEYDGHRTVRMQELDLATDRTVGERKILINKGVRPEDHPRWCEAPHIYKINGYYYLMTAEGGTEAWHSEVIYRSKSVWGPYKPAENNPFLTQRHLDPARENPITCAGHADMVQTEEGAWWAVFLACRPVEDDYENLGRETFMMPVTWNKDGWPNMTGTTEVVPMVVENPAAKRGEKVTFGNFTKEYDFEGEKLCSDWLTLRTSAQGLYSTTKYAGWLSLAENETTISDKQVPSFVARRLQHHKFECQTTMRYHAQQPEDAAGLVLFKDEAHHLFAAVAVADGKQQLQLRQTNGGDTEILAAEALKADEVDLKVSSTGTQFQFAYREKGGDWKNLGEPLPAAMLSTRDAGGFCGTMVGLYCTGK